jgi:hypothetical protein
MSLKGAYHLCFRYRLYIVGAGHIHLGICCRVYRVTGVSYAADKELYPYMWLYRIDVRDMSIF